MNKDLELPKALSNRAGLRIKYIHSRPRGYSDIAAFARGGLASCVRVLQIVLIRRFVGPIVTFAKECRRFAKVEPRLFKA